MAEFLTTGCVLMCSFGAAPSTFVALELPDKPQILGLYTATVDEVIPIDNIPPFGMCSSEANPEVVSATAAALGVLTPMPCVPVIAAPWDPPSPYVTYLDTALATVESGCECAWGGKISVDVAAESIAADAS
jgi:hypothetical protein